MVVGVGGGGGDDDDVIFAGKDLSVVLFLPVLLFEKTRTSPLA